MDNNFEDKEYDDIEIKEEKNKKIISGIYEWVEEFMVAISVIVILLTVVIRVVTVSGTSMMPNYYHNDRLVISSYVGEVKAGDVVVIVDVLEEPIIKRVIATEGQTVDISDGFVYVNGEALDNSIYNVKNGITYIESSAVNPMEFPCTVPENHIFVLGDNRRVSNDSRYSEIGMVDERKVLGKAIFNIFPFDRIGSVK